MVSVTCRLTTGVTETAGGGGAPWAAATPQAAATLSTPMAAFQASKLRPNIGMLLTAGDDFRFGTPPLRDSLHLREAAIHEGYKDVVAFVHEGLRGRQADAAAAAGDKRNFSFKLAHGVTSSFRPSLRRIAHRPACGAVRRGRAPPLG